MQIFAVAKHRGMRPYQGIAIVTALEIHYERDIPSPQSPSIPVRSNLVLHVWTSRRASPPLRGTGQRTEYDICLLYTSDAADE